MGNTENENKIFAPGFMPRAHWIYFLVNLHAWQPINADGSACGVAPELDELLD